MKNEKISEIIIHVAILTIVIYCLVLAMIHPIGWELITLIILPLLYIGVINIRNLKVRLITTNILSIIYAIISGFIFIVSLLFGFVENNNISDSFKMISINSPLILGFLILSIIGSRKIKSKIK